jgi:hypothetical protein
MAKENLCKCEEEDDALVLGSSFDGGCRSTKNIGKAKRHTCDLELLLTRFFLPSDFDLALQLLPTH